MPFKIDVSATPRQTPGQSVGTNSFIIEKLNSSLVTNIDNVSNFGDDLIDDSLLFDYDVGSTESYSGSGTNLSDIKFTGVPLGILLSYDPGNSASYSGSGTTITDLSGKQNNGTLVSGVTYSTSEGGFFTLNGTTGFISTTNQFVNPQSFSVGIWFSTTANKGKIIGFGNNRDTPEGSYDRQLYLASNGRLNCGIYDASNPLAQFRVITSNSAVNDGKWHYAVMTYNSNVLKFYVDGVYQNEISGIAENFSGFWRIGGFSYTGWPENSSAATFFNSSSYFAGKIGATHIYDADLTAAQIKQNFNVHCERKGLSSALDGPWTVVSTTSSYTDLNATEGDRYYFRAKYTQSDGRSSPYNEVINVLVGSQTSAPSPPNITLVPTSSSVIITLSGTPGTGHRIRNYVIQKFINSTIIEESPVEQGYWQDLVTQTGTTYTETGLTSGSQVRYRAKFVQQNGVESDFSAPQTTIILPPQTLSAPAVSLIVNSSSQITLNIVAAPPNGSTVASYIIERSTNQTTWTSETISSTASSYTYVNSGLTAATTYYYRVRFTTSAGSTSPTSSVVNGRTNDAVTTNITLPGLLFAYDPGNSQSYIGSGTTITDLTPPGETPLAPSVSATALSSSSIRINITATPLSGASVVSYAIRRSTDQINWSTINTTNSTQTSIVYDDTGLSQSTTYYYEVRFTQNDSAVSDPRVVNATTQSVEVPTGFNPPWPRLAATPISNHNYDTLSQRQHWSKFHYVIFTHYSGWQSGRSLTMAQVMQDMKQRAPAGLGVTPLHFEYVVRNESGTDVSNYTNKINAENWWVYDNGTSGTRSPSGFGNLLYVNNTTFCPKDSNGKSWNTWSADEFIRQNVTGNVGNAPNPYVDGFSCDNIMWATRRPGDFNRDGTTDAAGNATIAAALRAGDKEYYDYIRQAWPGAKYQIGNSDYGGALGVNIYNKDTPLDANLISPMNQILDGSLMEFALSGFDVLQESGTVTSAGSTTLTNSSKSWATNAWVTSSGTRQSGLYYSVKITSGTGAGQNREIISNNGTTLTVGYWQYNQDGSRTAVPQAWAVQPDSTSQYQIFYNKQGYAAEWQTRDVFPTNADPNLRIDSLTGIYTVINNYKYIELVTRSPKLNMFMDHQAFFTNDPDGWQRTRFGIGCCYALGDAYLYQQPDSFSSALTNWADEYDNGGTGQGWMGYPTGTYGPSKQQYQNVYRRDFDNAVVLLNPRNNGVRTVTLPFNVKKIQGRSGFSDLNVNNGQTIPAGTNIILQDRDALILVIIR